MTIYDEQIGVGGPVSALLGDNPGWLSGVELRGSGLVLDAMIGMADFSNDQIDRSRLEFIRLQEIQEAQKRQLREDLAGFDQPVYQPAIEELGKRFFLGSDYDKERAHIEALMAPATSELRDIILQEKERLERV